MKKILLATTILVGTAGFAAAEVALSGDARMGIVNNGTDTTFSSRARVSFTMSGETDGGLSFGASFRADNAVAASGGTAGSVYISGAFGKISMGDNDSAAQAGVGQVAGVGFQGLGDLNEVAYLSDGTPSVLYTYTADALTVMASTGPAGGENQYSLAAAYALDAATIAVGFEDHEVEGTHTKIGVSATVGGVALKAVYGTLGDLDDYAVSATYTADALSATVFTRSSFADVQASGIGASYSLGGGASVAGGYAKAENAEGVYDLGVTFSF